MTDTTKLDPTSMMSAKERAELAIWETHPLFIALYANELNDSSGTVGSAAAELGIVASDYVGRKHWPILALKHVLETMRVLFPPPAAAKAGEGAVCPHCLEPFGDSDMVSHRDVGGWICKLASSLPEPVADLVLDGAAENLRKEKLEQDLATPLPEPVAPAGWMGEGPGDGSGAQYKPSPSVAPVEVGEMPEAIRDAQSCIRNPDVFPLQERVLIADALLAFWRSQPKSAGVGMSAAVHELLQAAEAFIRPGQGSYPESKFELRLRLASNEVWKQATQSGGRKKDDLPGGMGGMIGG